MAHKHPTSNYLLSDLLPLTRNGKPRRLPSKYAIQRKIESLTAEIALLQKVAQEHYELRLRSLQTGPTTHHVSSEFSNPTTTT